MRTIIVASDGIEAARSAMARTTLQDNPEVESIVRSIIADVRARGDVALLELGRRFDSPHLQTIGVENSALSAAFSSIDPSVRGTLERSAANIRAFHEKQKRTSWWDAEPDRITGQLIRPLDCIGIYVPGGTAAYPSSVLMTAIPARVAGVRTIVLCTPAHRDGSVPTLVLAACHIAGVDLVFAVGGSQAIAAMASGTETVPSVDKVVGPGNIYVNIAKKQLWGVVDIDMLAGPSEVCVVADDGANPVFAALDMLTQAEHDTECAAYLITDSRELGRAVSAEIDRRLESLPRRDILRKALDAHGAIIVSESLEQAFELANTCAPEHLALMVRDPFAALGKIRNAGAILIGDYSPQTLGDYAAGPSHTLPTSGTARFASPLNIDTFMKKTSVIYYSRKALDAVADDLESFARAEGFDTHAEAVAVRRRAGESLI